MSDETLVWCQKTLTSLDHQGDPTANEFLPQIRHFLVPGWYRQLQVKARDHIESGEAPALSLALKPDIMKQWRVRQQVLAEMRNEVDTFGMVETEDMLDEGMEVVEGNSESDEY